MKKHFDFGTIIIIALTFVLFVAALFTTGFTHDLLLEAGVLLVSIKLMMMSYKNSISNKILLEKVDELKELISN
jgi:hypothetical protein